MSFLKVILWFSPLMMVVEMYVIIIATLVMKTLGLPQACLLYCQLSPDHSFNPRPECNCSVQHLQRAHSTTTKAHIVTPSVIRDSGIYYEPVKPNSSFDPSIDDQTFHMFNHAPSIGIKQNSSLNTKYISHHKTYNSSEAFGIQDTFDEHDILSSLKYKRRDSYIQKVVEETKDLPLHLYLDIDLDTSENNYTSQLEELKSMFENFQAAEKDLSECINLHIYIFSKYVDTINKTNYTNWGRTVEHDNLSTTQELTEIQNKCNQTNSIIKQSIYQIKNSYPPKEQSSELLRDKNETNHSIDSSADENLAQHKSVKPENYTITASDKYTTLATYPTDDYNVASTTDNVKQTIQENLEILDNNDVTDIKHTNFNSTSSVNNDQAHLKSAEDSKMNVSTVTYPTTELDDNENLTTTSKVTRTVLKEEEIKIPTIETKELSNGTLSSILGTYEDIPNSDFMDESFTSATSEESTVSDANIYNSMTDPITLKANIDKIVKSDLVEIHGSLYFLFGKKQMPARFIQQPDGELTVAIDGLSMCDQIKEDNTSNFMNLLCNCIHLQNCTYTSS